MGGPGADDLELLVGRDDELLALGRALADARQGHGSIALVSGEPGIGKSALCATLARRAGAAGVPVRWGRCSEVDGAPAFWPWRQVLGTWPERRPDSDRFSFLDSTAQRVLASADPDGLLVLLEDLHWADDDSLMLLGHLGRLVTDHPVLVVGTYRAEDAPPDCALERTIGGPLTGALSLPLRKLSADEVAELLRATAPATALEAAAVAVRADGNPFFVTQLARGWTDAAATPVPHGVRALVRTRLAGLPVDHIDVLSVAAALGRTFSVPEVRAIAGAATDDAVSAAMRRNLVVPTERPDHVHFVHALVREVLEERMDGPTRTSMHQRVLERLEATGPPDDAEGLAALARHALAAAAGLDQERVVSHVLAGARAAFDSGGAEEAIRLCRRALGVGPTTTQRVPLLVLLAQALFNLDELQEAERTLLEAAQTAHEMGDHVAAARALLEIGSGRLVLRFDPTVPDRLAAAHDRLPPDEEALRALVRSRYADFADDPDEVERACREAFAAAQRTGDSEAVVQTGVRLLLNGCAWMSQPERRTTFRAMESAVAPDAEWHVAFNVAAMRCRVLLEDGELDAAVAGARAADEVYRELSVLLHLGDATETAVAVARGDLRAAQLIDERMVREATRRAAADVLAPTAAGRQSAIARELDTGRSMLALLQALRSRIHTSHGGVVASQAIDIGCALVLAETGDLDAARELVVDVLDTDLERIAKGWGGNDLGMVCMLVQATHEIGFTDAADRLLAIVSRVSDRNVVLGMPPMFMLGHGAHFSGLCLHLAGRLDEAQAHLEVAGAANRAMRAAGPLARTAIAAAVVCADRGDGEGSIQHLRRARRALEGTELHDLRNRIQARLALLAPAGEITASASTTTFVFTDIVDSTARTRAAGDRAWRDVLQDHTSLLRALVLRHGGRVVKGLGDGHMLTFTSAQAGVDFARELQTDPRTLALGVRIGVHTGEAERMDDDHIGHHVNLAARVAAAAEPGEVLVSETVQAITSTRRDLRYAAARVVQLKGIGEVALHPLLLQTTRSS